MTMRKGLIACLPVIMLIALVMLTHRMTESMFAASLLTAILAYGNKFLSGYVEMIYSALSNSSYQLLLMVACSFGGMIMLLEKSGALYGFQRFMVRFCTTPVRTMVLTWILGGIIFIDDYLNALAVAVSMKGVADYHKIPREHLAYTINCMGACVCVLIPVSSWSAFAIGSLADYGLKVTDYYKAIPYMFYPFCCLLISLLLACRKFPLLGDMKKAYKRVEEGGSVLPVHTAVEDMQEPSENQLAQSSVWDFLMPMICLFVGMVGSDSNIMIGILLAVGAAAFFAASFWMLIVLTFPVFIPLAQSMGIDPSLVIAAIMSGVALGSQSCIFSDAVFMVASGTGVTNDDQFRTIFPYVAIGATVAGILFLIAGFLQ